MGHDDELSPSPCTDAFGPFCAPHLDGKLLHIYWEFLFLFFKSMNRTGTDHKESFFGSCREPRNINCQKEVTRPSPASDQKSTLGWVVLAEGTCWELVLCFKSGRQAGVRFMTSTLFRPIWKTGTSFNECNLNGSFETTLS